MAEEKKDLEKTKVIDKEEVKKATPKKKRPVKTTKSEVKTPKKKINVDVVHESKDSTIYLIVLIVLVLVLAAWLIIDKLFL